MVVVRTSYAFDSTSKTRATVLQWMQDDKRPLVPNISVRVVTKGTPLDASVRVPAFQRSRECAG